MSSEGWFDSDLLSSEWFSGGIKSWFDESLISGSVPVGTNVSPLAGSLALVGYAPTVTQTNNQSVAPSVGSLTITGYAPTVAQPKAINPGAGSLVVTGYAPTISQPQSVSPAVGSIAITGYAPSVSQSSASPNLIPGFGALSITGYAPTIEQSLPATAGGGRFKRKRVFIDGKAYFLNPQEVANLLIARAAVEPEEAPEELEAEEAAAIDPAPMPVIDYKAIRADSVQASREFIARMNAEIERMRSLAIHRQIEEEDDIECLLLLMA